MRGYFREGPQKDFLWAPLDKTGIKEYLNNYGTGVVYIKDKVVQFFYKKNWIFF